jgi:hypothetical protein
MTVTKPSSTFAGGIDGRPIEIWRDSRPERPKSSTPAVTGCGRSAVGTSLAGFSKRKLGCGGVGGSLSAGYRSTPVTSASTERRLRYAAMHLRVLPVHSCEVHSCQICSRCGSMPDGRPKGLAGLGSKRMDLPRLRNAASQRREHDKEHPRSRAGGARRRSPCLKMLVSSSLQAGEQSLLPISL